MGTLKYVIAVDQGSSGTMVALLDQHGTMLDWVDIPIAVSTPRYGWVEHDPFELAESIRSGARELMGRHKDLLGDLAGMGLANQGESFLLWDMDTGRPMTPVISWQDSRSEEYCGELQAKGYDSWFNSKTGLHLSSEWPALKLRYLRDNDPVLDRMCNSGRIAFGQLDAWFLYTLTGGRAFASDHGTACRSGLYNMRQLDWDTELVKYFKASTLLLPRLADNICHIDGVDLGIGRELPWVAGGLDQSLALIGQRCISPNTAKVTYGTCCACWMNLGRTLVLDDKLTTSVAWKTGPEPVYALAAEGGASGNIVTWLQRNFHTDWQTEDLSRIAQENDDQDALLFVPAFGGLTAPYWEAGVKGTLLGVTSGTRPEHILRAGFDAIAYTVRDILDTMPECEALVVDGGMTANSYLMQKQANVLGRSIVRTGVQEGTIAGITHLIRLSLGFLGSLEDLEQDRGKVKVIKPTRKPDQRGYRMWKKAIELSINYYKSE